MNHWNLSWGMQFHSIILDFPYHSRSSTSFSMLNCIFCACRFGPTWTARRGSSRTCSARRWCACAIPSMTLSSRGTSFEAKRTLHLSLRIFHVISCFFEPKIWPAVKRNRLDLGIDDFYKNGARWNHGWNRRRRAKNMVAVKENDRIGTKLK